MRAVPATFVLALAACGSSPSAPAAPTLEAHERAIGVDGPEAEVALGAWRCAVPSDRLAHVEVTTPSARLALEPAALGATLEALADAEADAMALITDAEVARARARLGGLVAIELTAGERRTTLAMQSPWRVVRLREAVTGAASDLVPAGHEPTHQGARTVVRVGALTVELSSQPTSVRFAGPGGESVLDLDGAAAAQPPIHCRRE